MPMFTRICRRLFLLLAIAALPLGGCASLFPKDNNDRSVLDIIAHFDKCGLQIDEIQPSVYTAILAEDGCALFIEGAKVEVYRYDRRRPKINEKLERIAATGNIAIFGLDFPAEVNGSFVLLTYTQHPKRDAIIRAFRKF